MWVLGMTVMRDWQEVGRVDVFDFHRDWMGKMARVRKGAFAVWFNIGVAVIRVIRVSVGHVQEVQ